MLGEESLGSKERAFPTGPSLKEYQLVLSSIDDRGRRKCQLLLSGSSLSSRWKWMITKRVIFLKIPKEKTEASTKRRIGIKAELLSISRGRTERISISRKKIPIRIAILIIVMTNMNIAVLNLLLIFFPF